MPLKEVEPIKVPVGEKPSKINEMNDVFAQISNFGDGRLSKMEVDYSADTDKAIVEADKKQKVKMKKFLAGIRLQKGFCVCLRVERVLWDVHRARIRPGSMSSKIIVFIINSDFAVLNQILESNKNQGTRKVKFRFV